MKYPPESKGHSPALAKAASSFPFKKHLQLCKSVTTEDHTTNITSHELLQSQAWVASRQNLQGRSSCNDDSTKLDEVSAALYALQWLIQGSGTMIKGSGTMIKGSGTTMLGVLCTCHYEA